jgi:exonuclease VII small subunit
MSNTLKNNAYHILGLDVSASEKDISKRSKEILNRLLADDTPEYDLDIGMFSDFRTEDSVKDALQRLQSQKKKIKEYFFWLQIADSVDEQVLKFLKNKDYSNAIKTWQNVSDGDGTKNLLYKKNLAILYCLVLSVENNEEYLKDSLRAWEDLINSDKFWTSFSKIYRLHDEQTASEDVINDFRKYVVELLSDIYAELHQIHKNNDYVNEFQKTFSVKGEKIEKNVLAPAYQAINKAVEGLEKMEVSKDGKFDKEESEIIKKYITSVQEELNKLIDLGLYEDSQTKIMRDRAANALRSIVIDLHNNLSELEKSKRLLEIAVSLAGTDSLKNKLKSELDQIEKNVKDDAESVVVIELPGMFKTSTIVFKNNFLEYNNKRFFYKDVDSIAFHSTATKHSVYYIPTGTTYDYSFSLISGQENISISLNASKDESDNKQKWVQLISLASAMIQPLIIKKIVDKIFNRGEEVKIGDVTFTKKGYYRIKWKMFGENEKLWVYWSDTIYIPKMFQGEVILWEEKEGKSAQFTSVSMSTPNAIIIPDLVQACYDNREDK